MASDVTQVSDNASSIVVASCWNTPTYLPNYHYATVIILVILNVVVISANLIVICIVALNKNLRSTNGNLFILSLAISDLTLGMFVLPLSTVSQTLDLWVFGSVLCRVWLAMDVWLCTASIYNLVVITVDRFIAVTRPLAYRAMITTKKVLYMIIAAWISSFLLCIPVIFLNRPELVKCQCTHFTNSRSYILSSAAISFYIPFMVILYFYFRIYIKVRRVTSATSKGFLKRTNSDALSVIHGPNGIRKSAEDTPLVASKESILTPCDGLRIHKGSYTSRDKLAYLRHDKQQAMSDEYCFNPLVENDTNGLSMCSTPIVQQRPRSQTWQGAGSKLACVRKLYKKSNVQLPSVPSLVVSLNSPTQQRSSFSLHPRSASTVLMKRPESSLTKYQKRLSAEIKTLKTVGIVTGCFLLSWIGFCLIYTLDSLDVYKFPEAIIAAFMWLGYANSAVNPFIYAGYNRQYRQSLKKLLKCGNDMAELCNHDTQSVFSGAITNLELRKLS